MSKRKLWEVDLIKKLMSMFSFDRATHEKMVRDPSSLGLLAANVLVFLLMIADNWDLGFALVVYWWQNIIIGAFNVVKILLATLGKEFDVQVGPSRRPMAAGKYFLAGFFMIHYGFFHFGYYMFLQPFFRTVNALLVFWAVAAFVVYEVFLLVTEFLPNIGSQEIGRLFAQPYGRIIPMHLVIIFGGMILLLLGLILGGTGLAIGEKIVMVVFIVLKIKADIYMKQQEAAWPLSTEKQ